MTANHNGTYQAYIHRNRPKNSETVNTLPE